MVKFLSYDDHAFIATALQRAAQKTSAKIGVSVQESSASYHAYALLYGLALGTAAAAALFYLGVVENPWWLCVVQLAIIGWCDVADHASGLFTRLVPRHIRNHAAAKQAMRDYHLYASALPAAQPIVFLYISVAERYVHVITSAAVHARIPGDWHLVTEGITGSIRRTGLRDACATAITQIADRLAEHFPV